MIQPKHIQQKIKLKAIREKIAKEKKEAIKEKKIVKSLSYNKNASLILMNDQRNLKNKYELIVKKILDKLEIKYVWQKPYYDINRWICVDFYLPDFNIVIEVDGLIHAKKEQKKYDKKRTLYLIEDHNINEVLRISTHQIITDLKIIEYSILGLFAKYENSLFS